MNQEHHPHTGVPSVFLAVPALSAHPEANSTNVGMKGSSKSLRVSHLESFPSHAACSTRFLNVLDLVGPFAVLGSQTDGDVGADASSFEGKRTPEGSMSSHD